MLLKTRIDEHTAKGNGNSGTEEYSGKDFSSDQDVRWCPGCGDYTILKQVQNAMPEIGVDKKDIVFISGIGCAARFPYYMDTFGMHSIHGRAPAIATGLKTTRPELSVWIITGDGDSLSIGANHFVQLLRRNVNVNLLLFNNQIYGLTKGQYSPTAPEGSVSKSTPYGSIDHPFNPLSLSLGADGTFIARAMDRDPRHLQKMLQRTHAHQGASMLEIYQNCIVFNDGAFELFTDKKSRPREAIYLEQDEPLIFGKENDRGIWLDGLTPRIVNLEEDGVSKDDLWIHDEQDKTKAYLLSRFFDQPRAGNDHMPRPFGVLYAEERPTYDDGVNAQMDEVIERKGEGNLDELLRGPETWRVD
ncbi:2-oxoacid:ferredoxin oxidoreductase subunit beta [Gracilimonas mengyeensis]|uniref:2-oxoglutarate ferredoxin oxidoreductase subunit beta n=1 Tax=Gracilimonas mengyeensis TaxID=1302730 RepID=A0A521E5E2_9BACT|nr:2-oxoacid:ferredoxin oxidoreductase subunit beta [Gracilimonas mengyeensis]SMO79166.1 2-oxoglutarate ferredoxin oxidoreductase subunit beta [Gracilimonas mengyeensis]